MRALGVLYLIFILVTFGDHSFASEEACLAAATAAARGQCEPAQSQLYETLKATCEARRRSLHCDKLFEHATTDERERFFSCDNPEDLCEQVTTATQSKLFSCGEGLVQGVIIDPIVGIYHLGTSAWEIAYGREDFPSLVSSCPDSLEAKKIALGELRPSEMTDETLAKMSCHDVNRFAATKADVIIKKLEQRRQTQMAESGRENLNVYDMTLSDVEKQALNFDQGQTGAAGKARCFRPLDAAKLVCHESATSAMSASALVSVPLAGAKVASRFRGSTASAAKKAGAAAGAEVAASTAAESGAAASSYAATNAAGQLAGQSAGLSAKVKAPPPPQPARPPKPELSADEVAQLAGTPEARLKRMKRFAQKSPEDLLVEERIRLEGKLGRPLTVEELEAGLFVRRGEPGRDPMAYLDLVKSFSASDKFEILKTLTRLESTHRRMEDFYFASVNALNKNRNVTSASLDRAGEKTFGTLESRMKKAETRFRFANPNDESKFYYFRRVSPENLEELAKGSDQPALVKAATEKAVDLRAPILGDYQRVLSVAEDLGSPKFKNFNKKFGHVDSEPGSNLFSLRLRPTLEVKPSGQIKSDSRPDLRALLCKTADGTIRVFKVYRKESFVSEAAFAAVEKEYYASAREAVAKEKLGCLKPNP